MVPNFFVIGAARSGTTSLCSLLGQHPDVFMCKPKEPKYFHLPAEEYEAKWNWYTELFRNANGAKAIGEGTPTYTQRPHEGDWPVPKRIFEKNPSARLIYIVRHPLERIVSNYRYYCTLRQNYDVARDTYSDFNEVLFEPEYRRRFLVDRSRYWFQISAFREYFSDDQILVVFFKEFTHSPLETLHRCTRFLGLDDFDSYQGLNKPQNGVPAGNEPTRFMELVKSVPGYGQVKQLLSGQMVATIRKSPLFYRRVEIKPTWDPEVRSRVIDWIRPDVEMFLEFYGKPKDYWSWD